jgi:dipeptidyl aminopeptidase/acylaminoacyl peptidase
MLGRCAFFAVVSWATAVLLQAEMKQPMTPEACTSVRHLAPDELTSRSPLQLSPDGTRVAYVLQVPDIQTNDNKEELYVSAIGSESPSTPVSVLSDHLITAIHWFPDNKNLAFVARRGGKTVLARVDSTTKKEDIIWEASGDITDYSMDTAGETIAIAVNIAAQTTPASGRPPDSRKGYHLDLESTAHFTLPRRHIYILRLTSKNHWTVAGPVEFVSPLSGRLIDTVVDNHSIHINLSPDGHYLLIDNVENFSDVPEDSKWRGSPLVRYLNTRGYVGLVVSYLYNIQTNTASMPLESPIVRDTLWAPDSKSYIAVALAPADSDWEAADVAKGTPNDHITHLFAVDVRTGKVSEVLNRAERAPFAWTTSGDVVVRDSAGDLKTFREVAGQWTQIARDQIPLLDAAPYSAMTSDGHRTVMEYENAHTPPELVALDLSSASVWTVAKLNPQADKLILPQTKTITWTTSTGYTAKGMLLLPPDYDPKRRYPLVIEDGSLLYNGEFVCDSGVEHVSSFARGILADAGIAYLMRYWPGNNDWESNYYPKGYPGSLAEVAFKQDLVESAVRTLNQRQIIDPTKVGLIGFSRGGWYVEYALAHSHISFRAATATDNVLYSVGEYWYWHNKEILQDSDGLYGGPPYGASLKNWLDYSVSFNLDKIHTPLLVEAMGYGKEDDDPDRTPANLAAQEEVLVGLNRLNKPVELYYYPLEQHQPDHPQARIASLQRNVDWYRFWLQGYERPNPEDPDQYKRWEHLRELRDADLKATQKQGQIDSGR